MIIRINGGASGISEYLEKGNKSKRFNTRDELDKRVILDGSLGIVDNTLKQFDKELLHDKYLHITLSFKEDYLNESILKNINDEFKEFVFSAYREDEYCYYSEAHLPKIKSLETETGNKEKRYPHIHVVIPLYNLKTGLKDSPLGRVDKIIPYIDSFQEYINHKYSLESPKTNPRDINIGKEEIINRHKTNKKIGNKEWKLKILDIIRDDLTITDVDKLAVRLEHLGFAKVRNSKKFGQPYINFKPWNNSRGFNLKEPHFLNNYLKNRYIEIPNSSNNNIDKHLFNIEEWHERKSLEIRFVDRKSKSIREHYYSLTSVEQLQYLKEAFQKVDQHFQTEQKTTKLRYFDDFTLDNQLIPDMEELDYFADLPHIQQIPHIDDKVEDEQRKENTNTQGESNQHLLTLRTRSNYGSHGKGGRANDKNLLSGDESYDLERYAQIEFNELYKLRNEKYSYRDRYLTPIITEKETKQTWSEKINAIDSRQLLNYLQYNYNLTSEHEITLNKSGKERINGGRRNFTPSDFLTQYMNLSWNEAKVIIDIVLDNQKRGSYKETQKKSSLLWQQFRMSEERKAQRYKPINIKKERRKIFIDNKFTYDTKKSYHLNIAKKRFLKTRRMSQLDELQHLIDERKLLWKDSMNERYLKYLHKKAQKGDSTALFELNRLSPFKERIENLMFSGRKTKNPFSIMNYDNYTVRITKTGNVNYEKNNKVVMIDTQESIKVIDKTAQHIEQALKLAIYRFGSDGFEISNASTRDSRSIESALKKLAIKAPVKYESAEISRLR